MTISDIKNNQFFVITGGEKSPLFKKIEDEFYKVKSANTHIKMKKSTFNEKNVLVIKHLFIPRLPDWGTDV